MNKPTTEIQFKRLHRETTANRQTAQTLKVKYRKCQKWIKSTELISNLSLKNGDIPQKQANFALKEKNPPIKPDQNSKKSSENERLQQYRPSQQDRKK